MKIIKMLNNVISNLRHKQRKKVLDESYKVVCEWIELSIKMNIGLLRIDVDLTDEQCINLSKIYPYPLHEIRQMFFRINSTTTH